jgi:hypothetical protein
LVDKKEVFFLLTWLILWIDLDVLGVGDAGYFRKKNK